MKKGEGLEMDPTCTSPGKLSDDSSPGQSFTVTLRQTLNQNHLATDDSDLKVPDSQKL